MDSQISGDSEFRTVADFALVHELMKKPLYDIPDHIRGRVIEGASKAMADPEVPTKTKLQAMKVILECDSRNIALLKLAMPRRVEHFNPAEMTSTELKKQIDAYIKDNPQLIQGAQPNEALADSNKRILGE